MTLINLQARLEMNYWVDPDNITNFNLNESELELNIIFWIFAAGKNGHTSAKCLKNFLEYYSKKNNEESPFSIVSSIENLPQSLKDFGVGCYNNKAKTLLNLINKGLNLKTCSVEELESIWGLGSKTARCFLIHSRKDQKLAGLDRHILSFLRDLGYDVPRQTPNKNQYKKIENIFIEIAESLNKTPSELDLEIWKKKRILPKKNIEKVF